MTYSHPVWDFIRDSRLAEASARSDQANACAATAATNGTPISAREQAYLASLAVYTNLTDPQVAEPADRLHVYADDLYDRVYLPYPTDSNAGYVPYHPTPPFACAFRRNTLCKYRTTRLILICLSPHLTAHVSVSSE